MTNSTDSHHGERSNGTQQALEAYAEHAGIDLEGVTESVDVHGRFVLSHTSDEDAWIRTQDVVEVRR